MSPTEAWVREHFKVSEAVGDELRCFCPLHQDGQKPSLYINAAKRLWKCHVKCGGGKLEALATKAKVPQPPPADGQVVHHDDPVTRYVPKASLAAATGRFWGSQGKGARKFLGGRGITNEVMKKFGLGLGEDNRVWIPVFDYTGGCCDVRRYDWAHVTGDKFLAYGPGYAQPRLWPHGVVEGHEEVLLMEGETDVLLAHTLGFDNAVTTTGGAGAWDPGFTRAMAGKSVFICYDIDDAGLQGAAAIASQLRLLAGSVHVLRLPISEPKNGDFTDYVRSVGGDRKRVHDFFADQRPKEEPGRSVRFGGLAEAESSKRLKLRAVVSGKDLTPFNVPQEVTTQCSPANKAPCLGCPVAGGGGSLSREIPLLSKIVLKSVMSPDSTVEGAVREEWGIPARCPGCRVTVSKTVPLWDLRLSPDVDSGEEEGAEGSRRAFSMRNLEMNQPYDLELVACSDPKTQYALLHVTEAKSSLTSIEQWTAKGKEALLALWEVKHAHVGGLQAESGKPGSREGRVHLRPGSQHVGRRKDSASKQATGKEVLHRGT